MNASVEFWPGTSPPTNERAARSQGCFSLAAQRIHRIGRGLRAFRDCPASLPAQAHQVPELSRAAQEKVAPTTHPHPAPARRHHSAACHFVENGPLEPEGIARQAAALPASAG